jgi:hypothetical protein
MTTSAKPWYTRRRYWAIVLFSAIVYFCFIPSPLRISPETTGFTSPLLPNGEVDYFGAYEQTYIHKLSPPEDNGMRLLLAACGPRLLAQEAMMNEYSWEELLELPNDNLSKQWFENQWIPLCEHMGIDPYAKPEHLDVPGFYRFLRDEWEANKEDENARYDEKAETELYKKLTAAPWTAEEYPDIARWLEQRSPVLDLFGVAVRKPNFACYRWRADLSDILLPDVSGSRQFMRELLIRMTERLGKGDIDGAWYDAMSMFYLSRKHYVNELCLVATSIGLAVENWGNESAKLVLQYGKPSPEQLERFANELSALPRRMIVDISFEETFLFSCIQRLRLKRDNVGVFTGCCGAGTDYFAAYLSYLPIDGNIAGKRIAEYNRMGGHTSDDPAGNFDWSAMKKRAGEQEKFLIEAQQRTNSPLSWLRVPLIHTRSQLVADLVLGKMASATFTAQHNLVRANARLDLLRIAVALERYKSAKGNYPETSDALVIEKYLDEVPMDIFTGRKTLTYQLAPDEATAFLLYSYGPNETDDGGVDNDWTKGDIVLRMKK